MADIKTRRLLRRTLGSGAWANPAFVLYPATTGAPATGVTLTSGVAPAWGVYADIITAALSPAVEFYLMQVMYDTSTGAFAFAVQILNATLGTIVFEDQLDITVATCNTEPTRIWPPVWCNAGDQIQGRLGRATAQSVNVSLLVATGL